ncbi:MAG: tandem-95 repeat protein [Pirellulales bacterium]|nr:tandem-95 repeat protein [Pirellulales bacterium]
MALWAFSQIFDQVLAGMRRRPEVKGRLSRAWGNAARWHRFEPLEQRALLSVGGVSGELMEPPPLGYASAEAAEEAEPTEDDFPDLDSYLPMPLLDPSESGTASGPEYAISYDIATGVETIRPTSEGSLLESDQVAGSMGAVTEFFSEEDLEALGIERDFNGLSLIDNPEVFPWCVNVKIYMDFGGDHYVGSGVLIDSMHVLTAGHCVYDYGGTGWADSIRVVPAFENGAKPFGQAYSAQLHSWTGWTNSGDYDHDIGVIDLDRPVGALTSWYGYGYNDSETFFLSNTFHNPGYPAESPYNGQYMYYWYGDFDYFIPFSNQVGITSQGYGGQSGSGAYYKDGDSRIVYSVLSNGISSFENFIRLTDNKFYDIRDDFIADDVPSTYDLIPLDVNVSPGTVDSGDTLSSLSYVVHNYSSVSWSGTVSANIYLSTDSDITSSDILLGTSSVTRTIGAKGTTTISVTTPITIPDHQATGNYRIGVILNASDYKTSNNDTDDWDAAAITVNYVNYPPVLSGLPDVALDEDTSQNNAIDLWVYASDAETSDSNLTYTIVGNTNPDCGVTIDSGDYVDINPVANWHGYSDVTVRVTDPEGAYDQDTFRITVNSINDVPVALGDTYGCDEDGLLGTYIYNGVLANDSDVDSEDELTAVLQSGPLHGLLSLNANGSFNYNPDDDYHGTDTFTYKTYDGQAYSSLATVTLNVASINDVPVALGDTYACNEDTILSTYVYNGVLVNDSDADNNDDDPDNNVQLQAVLQTGPLHGSLTLNTTGWFTYNSDDDYHGTDTFTYKAYDGQAYSSLATVALNVASVNDVPVALGDSYTCGQATTLSTYVHNGVLANDSDADNNDDDPNNDVQLHAVLQTGPSHGSLTLNTTGWFTYVPDEDYHGLDSFTYKADDGEALSPTATVLITVTPRIPGDASGDGVVDQTDKVILATYWGQSPADWEMGDFDGDNVVGPRDASILAANWGAMAESSTGGEASAEQSDPEQPASTILVGPIQTTPAKKSRWKIAPIARDNEPLASGAAASAMPDTLLDAMAEPTVEQSLASETTHDAALVAEYGPQARRSILPRERLAWSCAMASRSGHQQQDRLILEETTIDLLLTDLGR